MYNIDRYINNGRVIRNRIAEDVKTQKLSHSDLIDLMNNPDIKESLSGERFTDKVSKSAWNKEYLDKLALVAISETFNEDYLLYLDEVAQYVLANGKSSKARNDLLIILAAFAAIIVIILLLNNGNSAPN